MSEKISQATNNSGEVPPAYQEFAAFKGRLIPYEYQPGGQSSIAPEQTVEASESYAERQERAAQKEADDFLKYHKYILNKKPENITLDTIDADEAAANKAISAWAGLSEMARDLLYAKKHIKCESLHTPP